MDSWQRRRLRSVALVQQSGWFTSQLLDFSCVRLEREAPTTNRFDCFCSWPRRERSSARLQLVKRRRSLSWMLQQQMFPANANCLPRTLVVASQLMRCGLKPTAHSSALRQLKRWLDQPAHTHHHDSVTLIGFVFAGSRCTNKPTTRCKDAKGRVSSAVLILSRFSSPCD